MIEIIYKTKGEPSKEILTIKTPKNVKQIGMIEEKRKIYIEDYVMNYLKKTPLAEKKAKYGVLLGQAQMSGEQSYVFIKGVVEAQAEENAVQFDETIWNRIYSDIKTYYPKEKIVGWYLSIPYHVKGDWEQLKKMHIDHFAGSEKVCFFLDRTERQEGFFAYDNGDMERLSGYYIYYEKNPQLQQYFYDKNRYDLNQNEIRISNEKNSKRTINEGAFQKFPNTRKRPKRFIASYFTFTISAAVIAAGVMAIHKYSDIKNLNKDMAKIMQATRQNIDFYKTEVEKVNGNISTTTAEKEIESNTKKADKKTQEQKETTIKQIRQTESESQLNAQTNAKSQTNPPRENMTSATSQTQIQTKLAATEPQTMKSNQIIQNEVPQYTVKKGETLFEICIKVYNDANMLEQLKRANNLDDSCKLTEGQKIILP